MPEEQPSADRTHLPQAKPRGGLVPSVRVLGTVVVLLLAVAGVRLSDATRDGAATNLLMILGCFSSAMVLLVWFLVFSGYRTRTRLLVLAGLTAAIALAGALFKVDRVSGDLAPVFAFRWASPPDEMLEIPEPFASREDADLATTTENDFPQFLGPNRDATVSGITLSRDWTRNKPRQLWRRPIGAGWSSFVAVNGFAVTQEQRGDLELVTCYKVATGEPVWAQSVEARHATLAGGVGPRSTPTIHHGKVYTLGATGALHCLNGADGTVLWSDDLLARYGVRPGEDEEGVAWGRSASPLIVDDLVVVSAGGPAGRPCVSLAAFHKDTGKLVWEAGDRQVSYSSPMLATLGGVRQILSVNEDNISAHDPTTGALLWTYDWPGGSTSTPNVSQPVVLSEDRVLLSKGYGGGALLLHIERAGRGPFQTREVWRTKRSLRTKFTNVVVREGYLYGLSDGILECVDSETGTRQWKQGRYGHGQLLGVGPLLLVQAESGDVVLVEAKPTESRELGRFTAFEDITWNNLCLYGRLLLVRNAGEAACFELPVDEAPSGERIAEKQGARPPNPRHWGSPL